jgi:hypothetical protein
MLITQPPWYVWFDGGAVALPIAIGGFVIKRFWLKPEKTVEAQNVVQSCSITDSQVAVGGNITQTSEIHHHYSPDKPETELTLTVPDPLSILQSLDNLTPYDMNHAREKFVGLRVLWRITLDSLSETHSHTWRIIGSFRDEPPSRRAIVLFDLSSVSPELKVAHRGTPIWVRGAVEKVADSSGILLGDNPELLRIEQLPLP